MSRIISTHSYRGGTGKSNLTASLATALALRGRKVGIVDTDIQSPGVHVLFNLDPDEMTMTLNDFLWGRTAIRNAAYDVTGRVLGPDGSPAIGGPGRIHLIPSSVNPGEIARVIKEGYEVELLNDGLAAALDELGLDHLLIDTHPGLNEETLLSIAVSDVLVIILRPDQQDYQGSAVTIDVARRLQVPKLLLVVNKVLASFDAAAMRAEVAEVYGAEVAGLIPLSEDMLRLGSSGVMRALHPTSPVAREIEAITDSILA